MNDIHIACHTGNDVSGNDVPVLETSVRLAEVSKQASRAIALTHVGASSCYPTLTQICADSLQGHPGSRLILYPPSILD